MNKKILLIIILGIFYSGIFAQPAYYKLFNDSILSAKIVDRGVQNYLYCHVLEDEFLETYTPYSIAEYAFRGSNTFVARDVLFNLKKERVFLELLVDGKMDLYYFENETFFTFFYEDSEGNLVNLPKKGADKGQLLYLSILQKLASDCESTFLSTEKLRYTKSSLKKFFNAYNDCEDYSNSSPDTGIIEESDSK